MHTLSVVCLCACAYVDPPGQRLHSKLHYCHQQVNFTVYMYCHQLLPILCSQGSLKARLLYWFSVPFLDLCLGRTLNYCLMHMSPNTLECCLCTWVCVWVPFKVNHIAQDAACLAEYYCRQPPASWNFDSHKVQTLQGQAYSFSTNRVIQQHPLRAPWLIGQKLHCVRSQSAVGQLKFILYYILYYTYKCTPLILCHVKCHTYFIRVQYVFMTIYCILQNIHYIL